MHGSHGHGIPHGHGGGSPHSHATGSTHGHVHAPAEYGRAFAIGIALNIVFVAVETGFGVAANSVALLADAGHNLSDVLGLAVAWIGFALSRRAPSARFTYGLRGSSILAALANAVFLLVAVGGIAWEAVGRLLDPAPVASATVVVVATIGVAVNGATAWLFASGSRTDVNIRGAFLHMAADAAVSAGVVAAALLTGWTGRSWIDPATSLAIAAVVVWSSWGLLRDSVALSLNAVPPGLDLRAIRAELLRQPGVADLHDLHVWSVGTAEVVLTAHLVMPAGHPGDAALHALATAMKSRFGIGHATIQVETSGDGCPLNTSGAF